MLDIVFWLFGNAMRGLIAAILFALIFAMLGFCVKILRAGVSWFTGDKPSAPPPAPVNAWYCRTCKRPFFLSEHAIPKYCPLCGAPIKRPELYLGDVPEDKTFRCPNCSSLMSIHDGEAPSRCSSCGYAFPAKETRGFRPVPPQELDDKLLYPGPSDRDL